ncbi:MAG: 16S rRNA (cytosine(1402)-N(4))-methyltransferase RsmH [Chloroflexota bacterium]|nr:16S rRNA (cytosine(1402)-N(4))-methyltransferase RsmH [Chloroflexota bacterium]MEC9107910.1 16S rRNA (cytosine(1402)-N(4))-methyltransferase RsmH [Chloroflexota bacterium]MED5237350.1 16S rRNA (cytosine(1402)-N(4))-methyltransferase RsmH [Chloroflexota bacterium]
MKNIDIQHIPVMVPEILKYLEVSSGGRYIDCTLGEGGHTKSLLEASNPGGEVLGIDADHEAIEVSKNRLEEYGERFIYENSNFKNIKKIAMKSKFVPCHGILFDLGVSSLQLDKESRGFSFRRKAPLDMRFSINQTLTAQDVLNTFSESEISDILYQYGEERQSRKIAKLIIENRPLSNADELSDLIKKNIRQTNYKINPSTKTFQALRIYINEELNSLSQALEQSLEILGVGGRMAVISYHSLEDRIVKNFFKKESKYCICPPNIPKCDCGHFPKLKIITKKPVSPSQSEIEANKRSRSAKLRVVERI